MAKKKPEVKSKKKKRQELPENALPQNILPMGERVEENKNIYILQRVYKEIRKFTKNKTTNESGGVLVGTVITELGKTNILISGFVEAKYCEATPSTLKFTHETWEYIHKETEKRFPGKKILGWIHTHPDFGIFLSEYDKFIHENFFSEENQVAYVVDPIQHIEGFYFWIDGKLTRCKGFYIYDRTGEKLDIDTVKAAEPEAQSENLFSMRNILLGILSVAVIFLLFFNISLQSELKKVKEKQTTLELGVNNTLTQIYTQQMGLISELEQQVTDLETRVVELETIHGLNEKVEEPEAGTQETPADQEGAANG